MNIRIVREAGGLGDVIRLFPVMRALKSKYPQATLWIYGSGHTKVFYQHSGIEHRFIGQKGKRRPRLAPLDDTKWPYLKSPEGVDKWDFEVDEFCPAFRYEADHGYDVEKDRIQVFCEAAKVWPCDPLPRWIVSARENSIALDFLARQKAKSPIIALQPFCTDRGREWRADKWAELAARLASRGCKILFFDNCIGRVRRYKYTLVANQPIGVAAAILRHCQLLIAPDSGLAHLAAALRVPTLGLFASQSPEVMFRHYPLHSWLVPPRDVERPAKCSRWPCNWRRPQECRPSIAKQSCRVLAQLPVQWVVDKAITLCDRLSSR